MIVINAQIETIGDCYLAVAGLPDPQPDHPVIMVKFAKECMQKMNELTRKLEVSLGKPGVSQHMSNSEFDSV